MHLFECGETENQTGAPLDGSVVTPLGVIGTSIWLEDRRLPEGDPNVVRRLPSGARIAAWDGEHGEVELLVSDVHPELPDGMHIDGCRAVLWRFTPHHHTGQVVFRARWQPGYQWLTGAPEPGEGLDAQTWTDGQATVSVGTEAGDFLAARAANGQRLPQRLAGELDETGQALVTWDDESLIVPLPPLDRGELVQIQFVVSWTSAPGQGIATWLAVNPRPREILDEAGCN